MDSFLSRSEGLDHAEGASIGFMCASGGGLSEGYRHGGPGVCLGDGQTEAEGVTDSRQARYARILQIGLRLAIAQADARSAMPVSFR